MQKTHGLILVTILDPERVIPNSALRNPQASSVNPRQALSSAVKPGLPCRSLRAKAGQLTPFSTFPTVDCGPSTLQPKINPFRNLPHLSTPSRKNHSSSPGASKLHELLGKSAKKRQRHLLILTPKYWPNLQSAFRNQNVAGCCHPVAPAKRDCHLSD